MNTMTAAETLKNRLATIHKDMMAVSSAVGSAGSQVARGASNMKASKARWLTDEMEAVAARLDRMTLAEPVENLGIEVYTAARRIADTFINQRHNCRTIAQFIEHGRDMSTLIESGVFQKLIAKRKAAKAAVEAEKGLIDTIAPDYQAHAETVQAASTVEQLEAELSTLESRRAELSTIMQDESTSDADFDAANAEAVAVGKQMMQVRSDMAVARNAEIVAAKKAEGADGSIKVSRVADYLAVTNAQGQEIGGIYAGARVLLVMYRKAVEIEFESVDAAINAASEIQQSHVRYVGKIEASLKAEGVEFHDKDKAESVLAQCVSPSSMIGFYRRELEMRAHIKAQEPVFGDNPELLALYGIKPISVKPEPTGTHSFVIYYQGRDRLESTEECYGRKYVGIHATYQDALESAKREGVVITVTSVYQDGQEVVL